MQRSCRLNCCIRAPFSSRRWRSERVTLARTRKGPAWNSSCMFVLTLCINLVPYRIWPGGLFPALRYPLDRNRFPVHMDREMTAATPQKCQPEALLLTKSFLVANKDFHRKKTNLHAPRHCKPRCPFEIHYPQQQSHPFSMHHNPPPHSKADETR